MHPLAIEFFSKFSRFEYALKATGTHHYLLASPDGQRVAANWDKFARSAEIIGLLPRIEADPAMRVFLEAPPLKRVEGHGNLAWANVEEPRSMVGICNLLRRVRNNLFHGDKGVGESERDQLILAAGIAVLEMMLHETTQSVRDKFNEA